MRTHWIRMGPLSNMISVLIRRKEETQRQIHTEGRTPYDKGGRDLSDESTN